MSFAYWKKRSKLLMGIHWAYQDQAEAACHAAYKAGERKGRKDAKEIAKSATDLLNARAKK